MLYYLSFELILYRPCIALASERTCFANTVSVSGAILHFNYHVDGIVIISELFYLFE